MTSAFLLSLIFCLTYPNPSYSIFSMQQTLFILCDQFPLISNDNNSNLQCARLSRDENVPIQPVDLYRPTQLILFVIIDQSSSQASPINIGIYFNQSLDVPSSINEIHLGLLVTHANYTINNQSTTIYTPYQIPIFHWRISPTNTYELIDLLQLDSHDFETDTSLCKWNLNRWNRLFNGNVSSNVSYVYFLKTSNSQQLTFTLIDTSNKSMPLSPPSPYLNILYCVPYRLGVTEMILIICFGILFLTVVVILSILHYLKGGEDKRAQQFARYYHRNVPEKLIPNQSKEVRHRSSASISTAEHDDQTPN